MMWTVFLLVTGMLLSGFFSGSETGFYRATRTRLALDALSGDWISRGLIWLTNNPALFVATTLVGNNFANYVTTAAIVMGTTQLVGQSTVGIDLAVSIFSAPFIFMYGELLPKNLYYAAPNRLLRMSGPLFLVFSAVFAPLSIVLWLLGRMLEKLLGEAPEQTQLRLARNELRRVLSEGHEAGILKPMQRQLADGLFQIATQSLEKFCTPTAQLFFVRRDMALREMLRIARRRRASILLVQDEQRRTIGYFRVVDLYRAADVPPEPLPFMQLSRKLSTVAALMAMQEAEQPHAMVTGVPGRPFAIVELERLIDAVQNGVVGA